MQLRWIQKIVVGCEIFLMAFSKSYVSHVTLYIFYCPTTISYTRATQFSHNRDAINRKRASSKLAAWVSHISFSLLISRFDRLHVHCTRFLARLLEIHIDLTIRHYMQNDSQRYSTKGSASLRRWEKISFNPRKFKVIGNRVHGFLTLWITMKKTGGILRIIYNNYSRPQNFPISQ